MSGALASGLRWRAYGSGSPVTLIVPGLGATSGEARLPASGLPGTRVVLTLPGHGDAEDAPADYWSYERVAEDVAEVAELVGASRAIGTSLGTGALLRLLARCPDRFAAAGLLLPGALDSVRETPAMDAFAELAEAAESGQRQRLRGLVAGHLPDGVDVGGYVEARTETLARLPEAMRAIPRQAPLNSPEPLAAVTGRVLVLGANKDPLHAESVARAVAAAIPVAELEVLDSAAPLLTHREHIRGLLRGLIGT